MYAHRCSECTLYRCDLAGDVCSECLPNVAPKQAGDFVLNRAGSGDNPWKFSSGGNIIFKPFTVTMGPAVGAAPTPPAQPAPNHFLNGLLPAGGTLSKNAAVEAAVKLMSVAWAEISMYVDSNPIGTKQPIRWDEVYRYLMDYGSSP